MTCVSPHGLNLARSASFVFGYHKISYCRGMALKPNDPDDAFTRANQCSGNQQSLFASFSLLRTLQKRQHSVIEQLRLIDIGSMTGIRNNHLRRPGNFSGHVIRRREIRFILVTD